MTSYPDKAIPLSALRTGTCLALERSASLLADARLASQVGAHLGAAVLFSQAVEEFGKAVMLRTAGLEGSPVVENFYDHETKLAKAAEVLPADSLMIFEAAYDANDHFDAERTFGGESADDWQARLDWLYVGWVERDRRWRDVPRIDPALLNANIATVGSVIAAKQREWAEGG